MARTLKSDALLFGTTLVLTVVSLTWVYSATAITQAGPSSEFIKQMMWAALGVVALLVLMRVDYHVFCNRKALLWVAGATALALVLVLFFGHGAKGARRWIGIGPFGVQPSEFAKLVTIFFIATVLAHRLEDQEPLEPGLAQSGALLAVFVPLIMREPDYGTAIVLAAAAFTVMFTAGLPYRWLVTAAALVPPPLAAVLWFSPHSRQRLETWLDPYQDPLGAGWQTIQSYIAVGTGGVWGKGFAASVQKIMYLPEAHNDYIFAVICEEVGLVGALVVVGCFAVIIARGLRASRRAPDAFGALVALGITALFGVQGMVNLGVVTGLLPAKGIPLPFVSYGGSSTIVTLAAMGVLLNISQQASATE
jgi:cell division protein FtsW